MHRLAGICCVVLLAVAACSRDKGVRCEDPSLYDSSTAAPPLRVPDDLSVPDESQALLIPGASAPPPSAASPPTECLESPPSYFEGQELG